MHKNSLFLDSSEGSFDSRVFNYIEKNNSKYYPSACAMDKAAKRLRSKSFYNDEIAYIGAFFNWLFTWKKVGKDLAKRYVEWLQSLAMNVLFQTKDGTIPTKDIRMLIITPAKQEVHIVTPYQKIYPVFYHDFPTKKVVADDISSLHTRISEKVNHVLTEKKTEFKALLDLMNVLNHILPDTELNTSSLKKKKLIETLNGLSTDDEDFILLTEMAEDLLSDMKLIFSDIEIYWG